MTECEVAGCNRTAKSQGCCGMHRERVRKHGDPLASVPKRRDRPTLLSLSPTGTARLQINGGVILVDEDDLPFVMARPWHVTSEGYVSSSKGYMHRLLLPPEPGLTVDHANGDRLDNRRWNLRLATSSQNNANRPPPGRLKGVVWRERQQRFYAYCKNRSLGYYVDERDAAIAYNWKALEEYGPFA